jgi:hypothetical protein
MLDYARVRLMCSSIYAVILRVEEIVESTARSDLIWDDEAPGLCVRVYPDGSNSFIFLYRINGRQRFIRLRIAVWWSLARCVAPARAWRCQAGATSPRRALTPRATSCAFQTMRVPLGSSFIPSEILAASWSTAWLSSRYSARSR